MLISLGDNLDRGPKPKETIDFLLNLPNKILVKGNHYLLLKELINRGAPLRHDWNNGTADTLLDLYPECETWEELTKEASKLIKTLDKNSVGKFYFIKI